MWRSDIKNTWGNLCSATEPKVLWLKNFLVMAECVCYVVYAWWDIGSIVPLKLSNAAIFALWIVLCGDPPPPPPPLILWCLFLQEKGQHLYNHKLVFSFLLYARKFSVKLPPCSAQDGSGRVQVHFHTRFRSPGSITNPSGLARRTEERDWSRAKGS